MADAFNSNVSIQRVMEWRKRHLDDDLLVEIKRPRFNLIKLESESSQPSEEGTESIYSIQDKETDEVRDTTDTDTKSEYDSEVELEVEYEVASLSGDEDNLLDNTSSSGTDDFITSAAIAAAICESSLEKWATDGEESDNSSLDDSRFGRTDFWTCVQCKSENNNPLFRYCEKCFQLRKNLFPPRPRGIRKRKEVPVKPNPVKLDTLRSCLSGLSQDSGLGTSQEFPSLALDQIVVPEHLTRKAIKRTISESSSISTEEETASKEKSETNVIPEKKAKHLLEQTNTDVKEKALAGTEEITTAKENLGKLASKDDLIERKDELISKEDINEESDSEQIVEHNAQEQCILCNNGPKNSIFLHGNKAHMCCCYKCAIKTWKANKRCPICSCKVKNVVKVFTC